MTGPVRSALERCWYRAEPPPAILRPLSCAFGVVAAARARRQRARAAPLPVPVVVVGNISVGGTGKTPFVIWLVERLRHWGWRPGIVSRGYGGRAPEYPWPVTAGSEAAHCGDEPLLLARRLGVPLMVDPDRRRAAQALLREQGVDIVVADDGLQHYRLARDFEICVVDGRRGLGNGWLLPGGPLREPPSRLDAVDLVVVNGEGWSAPTSTPALSMRLALGDAWPLAGGPAMPLFRWYGKTVHAVAGIGNPSRFFDALTAEGVEVIAHPFPDHHRFRASDLDFDDDLPVLMTEKDAVKCLSFAPATCWAVPASARIEPEAAEAVRKSLDALRRNP